MSEAAKNQHIRAAYDVVAQRRDFHLEPRDVAILVLMLHELSRRSGQTFSISTESLPILRERSISARERPVIKRARRDYQVDSESVRPDQFPQRLQDIINEHLPAGAVRWSDVIGVALKEQPQVTIVSKLPELMQYMVSTGTSPNSWSPGVRLRKH